MRVGRAPNPALTGGPAAHAPSWTFSEPPTAGRERQTWGQVLPQVLPARARGGALVWDWGGPSPEITSAFLKRGHVDTQTHTGHAARWRRQTSARCAAGSATPKRSGSDGQLGERPETAPQRGLASQGVSPAGSLTPDTAPPGCGTERNPRVSLKAPTPRRFVVAALANTLVAPGCGAPGSHPQSHKSWPHACPHHWPAARPWESPGLWVSVSPYGTETAAPPPAGVPGGGHVGKRCASGERAGCGLLAPDPQGASPPSVLRKTENGIDPFKCVPPKFSA